MTDDTFTSLIAVNCMIVLVGIAALAFIPQRILSAYESLIALMIISLLIVLDVSYVKKWIT